MTLHGHIINGTVVLDNPIALPEGTAVVIDVIEAETAKKFANDSLMKFAGKAVGLPADASRNLDHYLYGYPKQ